MKKSIKYDKKIILSLIRDDLTSYRLVSGLETLGLEPNCYYLYLSEIIFILMGFEENEETEKIFEQYMESTEKVNQLSMGSFIEQVENLAEEIYMELVKAKNGSGK